MIAKDGRLSHPGHQARDSSKVRVKYIIIVLLLTPLSKSGDCAAHPFHVSSAFMHSIEEAKSLMKAGRVKEAIPILEKLSAVDSNSLEPLLYLAAACLDFNDLDKAEKASQAILAKLHFQYFGHFFLAQVREKQGRLQEALEGYKLSLAVNSIETKPFDRFVNLARQLGTLEQYRVDVDVMIVTGSLFLWESEQINGNTLNERAVGGTESALIYMARELTQRGKRVAVFCSCNKPGVYDGVIYRSNRDFEVAVRLSSPAVIIACRNDQYFHPKTIAKKRILWIHDVPHPFYDYLKTSSHNFEKVFCLSQYQKERWQESYSIPDEKFIFTTNGFDASLFSLGEKPRKNQIIYMSRPKRGLKEALAIFKELRKDNPTLEMIVCTYTGSVSLEEDPEWKPLMEEMKQPGIVMRGTMTKDQLAEELKQCRFTLYPNVSDAETSCIAAIESMAAGCPIVASDRCAVKETVINGETGILVPYTSDHQVLVQSLTAAARDLLNAPAKCETLSRKAREYAHTKYPWGTVADQWIKIIDSL